MRTILLIILGLWSCEATSNDYFLEKIMPELNIYLDSYKYMANFDYWNKDSINKVVGNTALNY